MDHRYKKVAWGPNGTRVMTSVANWRKPHLWNRKAEADGVRPRVFCASLADVFEDWQGKIVSHYGNTLAINPDGDLIEIEPGNRIPYGSRPAAMNDLRSMLFCLIDNTPQLDWLLLTKRPENIEKMWPAHDGLGYVAAVGSMNDCCMCRRENVWLGASVENQEYAAKRIPDLLKSRDLSPVLFLSCEPLLGSVDLRFGESFGQPMNERPLRERQYLIDWIIAGGESGPVARPADPNWFGSLRDQCAAADVPFHFRQWGEFDARQFRVGKKNAGRLLDGRTHYGFPVR